MKERINIISTGSKGNAVVIDSKIMVDCGVSFKKLEGVYKNLQLILLTHIHSDHFNKTTIKNIALERPTLKFVCCEWLIKPLLDCGVKLKNIFLVNPGHKYKIGNELIIEPVMLYHNVDNCGYKIEYKNKLLFYATDTYSLEGIKAIGFDLYMVEANYTDDEIKERIEAKIEAHQYIYEYQAMENHMSKERIDEWLLENMNENSEVIYLHQHRRENESC
jgi:phosphoribosyl 1,2-cyclic phosphodiesterase